jgi:ergothioneine biosynthesis protein EgtB
LPGGDEDREALRARYRRVRDLTEALAAPLRPEDQVIQSMADVSPTKWHRGHTTWFFETFLLEPNLTGYDAFDSEFRYLFNSYYEMVGPRHPRSQRGLLSRPTVDEVGRYRVHVDAAMEKLIDHCDSAAWPALSELVVLGLHHEQQHQELLLMDIKHVLFNNPVDSLYLETPRLAVPDARPMQMLEFAGGLVEVGHSDHDFAFDNESPRHKVYLEPFRIADRLVTAGEWIEFMAYNGYARPELWLSDGWHAVHEHEWDAPMYWRYDTRRGWSNFTLGGWRPVDPSEPVVHVSHYEADA